MPLTLSELIIIDDEKHERLWNNAILIFDTSSLLEFYFYSETTQRKIINEIFAKLAKRLWIPSHVDYEFKKNRKKVITKPVNSYKGLETEVAGMLKHQNNLIKAISELKSKTQKDDKHPFVDQSLFSSLDSVVEVQEKELKKFSEELKDVIGAKVLEIEAIENNDPVLVALGTHFEIGQGFRFDEILEIVKEGKLRYEFKIPPGYEDYTGKEPKEGIQIFGDLIIWKEILTYAKSVKKPIVLISNELKPDWCYRVEKQHYIERPKEDLIREIYDFAGVEFWMYSNLQLLYYAKEYLKSEIAEEEIAEVAEVSEKSAKKLHIGCRFIWPVNGETSIGGNPLTKSLMSLQGANGEKLHVDWGDGTNLEEIADTRSSIKHTYPDFGVYEVKVYGEIYWFCAMGIGQDKPEKWTQYPKVLELHIEHSLYLDRLQCAFGSLNELELGACYNLTQLLVPGNHLEKLRLTDLSRLRILFCDSNLLTELNVSNNPWISNLRCNNNRIKELKLELLSNLEELDCSNNKIDKLILGKNNLLNKLNCSNNLLSENALNDIFINLPSANGSEINVRGNVGSGSCNKAIAQDKGWIVVY